MDWTSRRSSPLASLLLVATMLGGCASVHVDDQGRTHIVGLVWLTLPEQPDGSSPSTKAANVVRTRNVGLTLQRGPEGGALSLGYSDAVLTTVYNDSVVLLPPGGLSEK